MVSFSSFTFTGNGSDVFGSDICTCKPYLVYAIEECIHGAQRGGVGVVVYFRKEGRALGEVTKYIPCLSFLKRLDFMPHLGTWCITCANVAVTPQTSTSNPRSSSRVSRTC